MGDVVFVCHYVTIYRLYVGGFASVALAIIKAGTSALKELIMMTFWAVA